MGKGTNRVAASYSAAEAPASKEKRMRALWSGTSDEADEADRRLPVLLFLGMCRGRASWLLLFVRTCRSAGPSMSLLGVVLCSASSSLCAVAPGAGEEAMLVSKGAFEEAEKDTLESRPSIDIEAEAEFELEVGATDAPVSDFAP